MPYVWIADGVDTRRLNQYVIALRELLLHPDGPQELGILQLIEELDSDQEMYSAVWAHLDHWMRSRIKDFRQLYPKHQSVITDDRIKF